MSTYFAIPIKDPARAKERLAETLDAPARRALAVRLFRQTLDMLEARFAGIPVVIVTDSEAIAGEAEDRGHRAIKEMRAIGLSRAAEAAAAWGKGRSYRRQILLPADIAAPDPDEIATLLGQDVTVAIARASDGGTNCLVTTPPDAIPFQFGPDSAARHAAAADAAGHSRALLDLPALARDVDRPDDLVLLAEAADA